MRRRGGKEEKQFLNQIVKRVGLRKNIGGIKEYGRHYGVQSHTRREIVLLGLDKLALL